MISYRILIVNNPSDISDTSAAMETIVIIEQNAANIVVKNTKVTKYL